MSSRRQAIAERYSCSKCLSVFRCGFMRCPICGGGMGPFTQDPLIGRLLGGKYLVEKCVGEGGMGRVYKAHHKGLNSTRAIKVLFGDHAADPKMRERLEREARAVAALGHVNVISIQDIDCTDDGLLFLVMEFVDGAELAQLIAKEAPFDPERIAHLLRQLCLGLAHAHDAGLVHRDFKSENVLVSETAGGEVAKIVDFGVAFMLEGPGDEGKLTTEGIVLGTPAFMAPEQSTGGKVDARSDLFSLGVCLYEMLCGKLPFDGTPIELARQNMVKPVPRISERVPGLSVDPALEDIAFGLLAKRPEERFQSAVDVLRALDSSAAPQGRRRESSIPPTLRFDVGESRVQQDSEPTLVTPYPTSNRDSLLGIGMGDTELHVSAVPAKSGESAQGTEHGLHAFESRDRADSTGSASVESTWTGADSLSFGSQRKGRKRLGLIIVGATAVAGILFAATQMGSPSVSPAGALALPVKAVVEEPSEHAQLGAPVAAAGVGFEDAGLPKEPLPVMSVADAAVPPAKSEMPKTPPVRKARRKARPKRKVRKRAPKKVQRAAPAITQRELTRLVGRTNGRMLRAMHAHSSSAELRRARQKIGEVTRQLPGARNDVALRRKLHNRVKAVRRTLDKF